MADLQIVSDGPGGGKTSLAGALAVHLAATGKRAAYYKPFSPVPAQDPDVAFFSSNLLTEESVPKVPSPHPLPPASDTPTPLEEPLLGKIQEQVAELKGQSDAVLIESPDVAPADRGASTQAIELASALDSKVLLLFRYSSGTNVAAVVQVCQTFGERLAGVIINGVTAYRTQHVNDQVAAGLRAQGIPFLGTVREDRTMLGVTVQQIADVLGGRWVQEPENVDAPIERFLIGGNIMDAGPTYFGRYSNQAVITRTGRPDIQLASLMCDTRCLILTGGDEPAAYVKAEAFQRGVPLISVESGTLETAEALGGMLDVARVHSRLKIERFRYLLQGSLDLDALADAATA